MATQIIKKDDNKQKWESATDTSFPLVCETCLGDNPYVRMTKENHGKPCAICETPFTVFAWQAGTRGRLKRVEICRSCARAKNVCQVCIYDLQYGLPVKVRDRVLAEGEREGGGGGGGALVGLAVPQSDANRAWYNAQQEQALARGDHMSGTCVPIGERTAAKLQSMARMEPRYERNLPKLCSFFAKGECNRGSKCPFRHEMPKDRNDPLSHQNTKDRFYGTNDPVANAILGKRKERMEKRKEEIKASSEGGDEENLAVSTAYIRFDERDASTAGISISQADVKDAFYSFGEITSVRMHLDKGAFVEYTTRDAASLAIASKNRKNIKGRIILVSWARQSRPKTNDGMRTNGIAGPLRPMAPPGSGGSSRDVKKLKSSLPLGFTPSAQVAAAAASRLAKTSGLAATGLAPSPVPGIRGVIRRLPTTRGAAPKPYYPSTNPGRLGS